MSNYKTASREELEAHFDGYFDTRFKTTEVYTSCSLLFDWGLIQGLELAEALSRKFCEHLRQRCTDEFHKHLDVSSTESDKKEDT